MDAVGRNQPCPCGSGRRYKECHGSFSAPVEDVASMLPPSRQAEIAVLMNEALALQQEGRFAEAIARYETAVAEQPRNFDALHMLGVAWFQSNQLDRADDYVGRALAIRPDFGPAQSNRALIADARRLAAMEAELCRQVLPKMSALFRANRGAWRSEKREPLDLIIAARALDGDDLRVIERIAGDPRFDTVTWRTPVTAVVPELEAIPNIRKIGAGAGPASEFLLVYGVEVHTAAWVGARLPAHVALLVNADLPCELLDRVRELSDQGRSPISIIFNRSELRSASGLPGLLLEEWFTDDPLQ